MIFVLVYMNDLEEGILYREGCELFIVAETTWASCYDNRHVLVDWLGSKVITMAT